MVSRFVLDMRDCIDGGDGCKARMAHSVAGAFVYHDELEAAHARAEAYKEALVKIVKRGHAEVDDRCRYWNGPSHGCDCHVSIAEEALNNG